MTSAASPSANQTSASAASTTSGSSTPQSGAVPAQLPVRSYASATKTASSTPPAAAGASAPNAKSTESSVNGSGPTAQGGSQPATNGVSDHGRKPSMVISATGSSGYTQNGGPVTRGRAVEHRSAVPDCRCSRRARGQPRDRGRPLSFADSPAHCQRRTPAINCSDSRQRP
jgi:translation initiation factor 4G